MRRAQTLRFYSKRNEVVLRDGHVHKHIPNAPQEAAILKFLSEHGVRVPQVISCTENLLVLEHLPGETLPDLIEHGAYNPANLAQALCDWFAAFYAACPGKSRGDVNGRNFLYDGNVIDSVDFEDALAPGSPARDGGRLAAFLATYETHDKKKQAELVREFTQRFGGDLQPEYELELLAMQKRRTPA
jgi:tRNA A-37 threonylcarbamoyl transferase component Bud32